MPDSRFTVSGPANWTFAGCPECGQVITVLCNGFCAVSAYPEFGAADMMTALQRHAQFHARLIATEKRLAALETRMTIR